MLPGVLVSTNTQTSAVVIADSELKVKWDGNHIRL